MKFSKLFGKFFIALVVPSLMISSCALLGLEEEEDETETASSLSTPSSSGSITIGSYSYSSSLKSRCTSFTDGGNKYDVRSILSWDTSARTATYTQNIYKHSACTISAGSTVTLGGTTLPNPISAEYSDIQVNKMTMASGTKFNGADGNSVTDDSNLYGVVGKFKGSNDSNSTETLGALTVIVWSIPESNTESQMSFWDECENSTGGQSTSLNDCTHYWGSSSGGRNLYSYTTD